MTQTIENRAYGVDVSSFNNANVTEYTNAGANFVLVKVSEGLDYRNPKAKAQVDSTKQNNVVPMGYTMLTLVLIATELFKKETMLLVLLS